MRRLWILALALLFACNDSRSTDGATADVGGASDVALPDLWASTPEPGCGSSQPFCVEACADDFLQPAVCLVDSWVCPPGTQLEEECGSAEPADCAFEEASEIPGVRIEMDAPDCRISREEALETGVTFRYRVIVDSPLELVPDELPGARCVTPDDRGVQAIASINGVGGNYCNCDFGRCAGPDPFGITLEEGVHEYELTWSGRSWNGPSDTMVPEGEPFEFGTYVFSVTAAYLDGDGVLRSVQARAAQSFELTP